MKSRGMRTRAGSYQPRASVLDFCRPGQLTVPQYSTLQSGSWRMAASTRSSAVRFYPMCPTPGSTRTVNQGWVRDLLYAPFYKPQPPGMLEEIRADILALEAQSEGLLGEILGRSH